MVHHRIQPDRVHVLRFWLSFGEGAEPVPEIKADPPKGMGVLSEASRRGRAGNEGSLRVHTCEVRIKHFKPRSRLMNLQEKFDFVETYRSYLTLFGRSKTGIEFSFIPDRTRKGNPRLDTGTLPEADHDRKKGFRCET